MASPDQACRVWEAYVLCGRVGGGGMSLVSRFFRACGGSSISGLRPRRAGPPRSRGTPSIKLGNLDSISVLGASPRDTSRRGACPCGRPADPLLPADNTDCRQGDGTTRPRRPFRISLSGGLADKSLHLRHGLPGPHPGPRPCARSSPGPARLSTRRQPPGRRPPWCHPRRQRHRGPTSGASPRSRSGAPATLPRTPIRGGRSRSAPPRSRAWRSGRGSSARRSGSCGSRRPAR